MSRRRRWTALIAAALVLLAVMGALWQLTRPLVALHGRVLDVRGEPLEGVSVTFSAGGSATTDADGQFSVASRVSSGWLTAVGPGFLSRTRAALANDETLIRLLPDDGETVRLLFAGDVMFGRRFYDTNDDGDPSDGLLRRGSSIAEHGRLLDGIAPLLADADLTVVNLESPLIGDPWFDSLGERPTRFHQTKEFVFGSAPEAAGALHAAGVDIIGLGNNHQYDALDDGIVSTQRALLGAGFAMTDYVGAGQNLDEAWRPATREVKGVRIAVVACTTITGSDQGIDYVAGVAKGGAARCEASRLATAVRAARADADLVVVMIHGGFEYVREPSETVRRYSEIAHQAGAALVINHHPHVVGGLAAQGETLTAWTMGNLLFDQTVWPTFNSYVLRVDVRRGAVIGAYIEPFMLEDYQPVGIVGARAEWVAREAQSLSDGAWVVDDGALMLDKGAAANSTSSALPPPKDPGAHPILDLDGACVATPGAIPGALVGRDEAWTGDFEDLASGSQSSGGALWNVVDPNPDRQLVSGAGVAHSTGVRLSRSGGNREDITLSPLHRFLVQPGDQLSVILDIRGTRARGASLQMSWYNDTLGPSQAQSVVPLPVEPGWREVRVDFLVPAHGVATGLYLRFSPVNLARVSIDLDNVKVVVWHPAGARAACEYMRFDGAVPGALSLTTSLLPNPSEIDRPTPAWIEATAIAAMQAQALPPGPVDSGWGPIE